jgi:Tfp pilus assembly protein PilN
LRENNGLTPEYTRAAGLALKKLYPLFNTIDLLPEDRKIIVRNQREKKRALSSMLGFGAFFLIILLVLTVIKLIQAGELEDVEAQMFALNEQIFAAEQIQKEQINLQQALLDMQNLVTRRSRVAEFLEALSSTLPRNVWLQEFSCELEGVSDGETGKPVVIRGWAFDEAQMAAFLSRLESFDFLRDVQLQGTERIPADEVWNRSRLRKISLIEFTISASLKND